MRRGPTYAYDADLDTGGGIEFNGAAEIRRLRIFVRSQGKGQIPVGGEPQDVGSELVTRIIANHHWNIHLILTDPALRLAGSFRVLLGQLQLELEQLSARIEQMDAVILETAQENEACQRLTAIPGIGPVTATALVAAIGNGAGFRRGKDLAAWVGMVPREYSTGGKQKLLGISKRGNSYLRRLFVQGARVVMQYRSKQAPGLSNWLSQLMARTHQNVAVVALANKLLRMAWAVLCKNETYRIPALATAP